MRTKPLLSKKSLSKHVFIVAAIYVTAGLLPAGCNIFQPKEIRIIEAIKAGNTPSAEQLIQKGSDLNFINESDTFALYEAASTGNLDLVKLLVNKGADINLSNKFKMTALMAAIDKGHKDVADYLIERKADMSMTNRQNYSALHIAAERGRSDIIEILLNNGAPTEYSGKESISVLTPAILNDDLKAVHLLLDKNVNPNPTKTDMEPPLIAAAKSGNLEMVNLLIKKGANISAKNADGRDAISNVGGLDKMSIAEAIYKRLDRPIHHADTGETAVDNKKQKISLKRMVFLLTQMVGDKKEIQNKMKLFNNTYDYSFLAVEASDHAIQTVSDQLKENYIGIIKLLLHKGADINTTDRIQSSVLILQGNQKDPDIVALFIKNGIIMEPAVEHQLRLVIQKSSEIQNVIIQLVIDAKANMNRQDQYGQSALMAACSNGNLPLATVFINNGADVNQTNNEGWTSLINAVSMEGYDIAELLLRKGADVNASNNFGETPLLKAVYRNNEKMVKLLLKYGADPHRASKSGDSPLSVAKNKGYANIIKLLAD